MRGRGKKPPHPYPLPQGEREMNKGEKVRMRGRGNERRATLSISPFFTTIDRDIFTGYNILSLATTAKG